jgi:hypothetical protein
VFIDFGKNRPPHLFNDFSIRGKVGGLMGKSVKAGWHQPASGMIHA